MMMQMMFYKILLLKFLEESIISNKKVNFSLGCIELQRTNLLVLFNKRAKERNVDITEYQHSLVSNLDSDLNFDGDAIQLILQKAIQTLPTKQQLVFNMKYFDELKYKDISEHIRNF